MNKIIIIAIGGAPKGPLGEVIADFGNRLTKFVQINWRFPKTAEEILQKRSTLGKLVILEATGTTDDSVSFAKKLEKSFDLGETLTFVVGDAFGLSAEIKASADWLLSLSPLTTTHELALVLLLEQLYRGCTIIRGQKYHY